jgi:hypothetical protein
MIETAVIILLSPFFFLAFMLLVDYRLRNIDKSTKEQIRLQRLLLTSYGIDPEPAQPARTMSAAERAKADREETQRQIAAFKAKQDAALR